MSVDATFAAEYAGIRLKIAEATTTTELINLDSGVDILADALVKRTELLEAKLMKLKGAVALGNRHLDEAKLETQAREATEQ